jgi:hypothetical protein
MNIYDVYEALKRALDNTSLTTREYQAALRLLAEVCGI